MAQAAPCQACLEVPDADFYVTNRLGMPWPFDQSTVALCAGCFIRVGNAMGEAMQAAMAELEAMAEPGTLEQIEAAEGPVEVAPTAGKRRRQKVPAAVPTEAGEANPSEAEATDDQR